MDFVLTLVASTKPLSGRHIASIEHFAQQENLDLNYEPEWLVKDKALDIYLEQHLTIEQIRQLREIFDSARVDVFCTRTENRQKSLFLADMDSTIVTSETLDELAAEAGIKEKISAITEKAMRGELDFNGALKERVGLLEGLPEEALQRTLQATEISQGAESLLKAMNAQDAFCVLVSGGFTFFTGHIANKLGFSAHHGNILGIEDGKLTGKVKEPILNKDAKLSFLKLYCEEMEVDISDTVAIGDGANDLPMLEAAGIGIGYHPKPLLEEKLHNCIRHTDLTSVLFVQGYKDIA